MEEDAVWIMCNETAPFQRLMAQALTNVTKKYGNLIMCYVDDVVIALNIVDCTQFWDAVADAKHPRHEEALSRHEETECPTGASHNGS